MFENLHQGRILCATMAEDNMLLTGGDSTVCACVHVTLSKCTCYVWYIIQIVCVWEIKNVGSRERSPVQLQLKHTLHGHTDSVTCIAASTAYNIIVSGSKVCGLAHTHMHTYVHTHAHTHAHKHTCTHTHTRTCTHTHAHTHTHMHTHLHTHTCFAGPDVHYLGH